MEQKSIWVGGDFFRDVHIFGSLRENQKRFDAERTLETPGGAWNTLENLKAICQKEDIVCRSTTPTSRCQNEKLRKWVGSDGNIIFECWDIESAYPATYMLHNDDPWSSYKAGSLTAVYSLPKAKTDTIIISDYNKGFVSHPIPNHAKTKLLVVDSKYRTFPIQAARSVAKTSIWRCTGPEYCAEYAKHFDIIVWTNGSKSVQVFGSNVKIRFQVEPPPITVVDSCGAGDTFTAALAAHLTRAGEVNEGTLRPAVTFAVEAAQDVCRKPFTAITSVHLGGR